MPKGVCAVCLKCGGSLRPLFYLAGHPRGPVLIFRSSALRLEGQGDCSFPSLLCPANEKCVALVLHSNSFSSLPRAGLLVKGSKWM